MMSHSRALMVCMIRVVVMLSKVTMDYLEKDSVPI